MKRLSTKSDDPILCDHNRDFVIFSPHFLKTLFDLYSQGVLESVVVQYNDHADMVEVYTYIYEPYDVFQMRERQRVEQEVNALGGVVIFPDEATSFLKNNEEPKKDLNTET